MAVTNDDDKNLAERRRKLEVRLVEQGVLRNEPAQAKSTEKASAGQAVRLASEFLAAVVVGVMLGLGFDQVTGFSPWGLVVFLFLGFAAGVLNMLRSVGYVDPHPVERQRNDESLD